MTKCYENAIFFVSLRNTVKETVPFLGTLKRVRAGGRRMEVRETGKITLEF